MAYTATTVLPLPTSPCSSRFIGSGAGHVGGDLGNRLVLARRSARRETAGGCGRRSWPSAAATAAQRVVLLLPLERQRQLQDEKLLVDEPPPGLLEMLAARWESGSAATPARAAKVVRCQVLGRKDFVELARAGVEHRARPSGGCDAAALRSADRRPAVARPAAPRRLRSRGPADGPFPSASPRTWLAGEQQRLAAAELLAQKGLVEPDGPQVVRCPAAASTPKIERPCAASARSTSSTVPSTLTSGPSSSSVDRAQIGQVLVIAGEEEEHIANRAHAEPGQQFGRGGPQPLRNWTGVARSIEADLSLVCAEYSALLYRAPERRA